MFLGEKEEAVAEALIRQRVEALVNAIRARDIDDLTSGWSCTTTCQSQQISSMVRLF